MPEEQAPYEPDYDPGSVAQGFARRDREFAGWPVSQEKRPRLLVAATSFVENEGALELCKLSVRVIKALNLGEDFILIDAGGPFDPRAFLPETISVFRFDENVGSITRGGKDGAGRGVCRAIEMAIAGDYDYVAIHETDAIFAESDRKIVERMHRSGVKVASPGLAAPYQFLEWSSFWISVAYARESDFIKRYSWETTPRWPLVEMRLEKLFGEDLFLLPMRGFRNEGNQVNVANIAQMFPYYLPSWLTHCADQNVYARWLDLLRITPD